MASERIHVLDSHTAGEPTRCVLSGGPDLGGGPLSARRDRFRSDYDCLRSAIVNEPRGSNVIVGALLCEPSDSSCAAGVIFFNNVGYLGMCGHGTIGVIATLAHLGRIQPGTHRIETPVGIVSATLRPSGEVTIRNVPSYRTQKSLAIEVPGYGTVRGDVAWGGNWFYLVEDHTEPLTPANLPRLTAFTSAIRQALAENGIPEADHVELFGPPHNANAHSRNFVLCPGGAYDRSPCGTGTSAKMACLYADGKLVPGQPWRQEGILGTVFEGSIQIENGHVIPSITGSAYITAESTLILDPDDPFRTGITA